jgi:hypothetical protein
VLVFWVIGDLLCLFSQFLPLVGGEIDGAGEVGVPVILEGPETLGPSLELRLHFEVVFFCD